MVYHEPPLEEELRGNLWALEKKARSFGNQRRALYLIHAQTTLHRFSLRYPGSRQSSPVPERLITAM